MKKTVKRIAEFITLFALCLALGLFAAACGGKEDTPPADPIPPVKVSDGIDFELADGKSKNITIADYITVNDYEPSASTSDTAKATAAIADGVLTVTAANNAEGSATVTLSCGDISIEFGVSVYLEYDVSVDDSITEYEVGVKKGEKYKLPAAPESSDADLEFSYWVVSGVGIETTHEQPSTEITVNCDLTVTAIFDNIPPEAVPGATAPTVSLSLGGVGSEDIAISDYIVTHGNKVSAQSADLGIATAAVNGGTLTITAVADGNTTVALTCGKVEFVFNVAVSTAPVTYTVTVNGADTPIEVEVPAGSTYTLPPEPTPSDPDYEFKGWKVNDDKENKAPGVDITVNADTVINAVFDRKAAELAQGAIVDPAVNLSLGGVESEDITISDYIVTHGRAVSAESADTGIAAAAVNKGTLTITAVGKGNTTVTLACGEVSVEFQVGVTSAAEGAPVFTNGSIDFDLFDKSNDTCEFDVTAPSDANYTYSYTVTPNTGVTVSGDSLTYTASEAVENLVLNVSVSAQSDKYGSQTASFKVTVNVTDSTPTVKTSEVDGTSTVIDIYDAPTIDLAANIDNADNVASYTVDGASAGIENGIYTVADNSYTADPSEVTLNVVATDTKGGAVSYTYKIKVVNSTAYRIKNGGFENGDSDWTKVLDGSEEFYNITDADAWFDNIPYGKEGAWLLSGAEDFRDGNKAGNGKEGGKGTLTSSAFTLKKNAVISFKLGGAKNPVTGIRVIDGGGNILAQFYNTRFADGTLVRYYYTFDNGADIENCKIVIYDNAVSDWGLVIVDSIVTYYDSAFTIPAGANIAENAYADKTALVAAIGAAEALNITEQGDYTKESYDAFVAALSDANSVNNDYALPADVDAKTAALTAATENLAVREPAVKQDITTAVSIVPNGNFEIDFASYFDTNGLSKITYTATTESDKISIGAVADGKAAITAGADEAADIAVTLSVLYDGVVKKTVTLTVDVSAVVVAPQVADEAGKSGSYDLYACTDGKITLNLASNVIVNGNTTLKYYVSVDGGEFGEQIVDPTAFEFTPSGTFTETAQSVVLTVKVEYEATAGNGSITYGYTLNITDTTSYRITNGNFDSDLTGWTLSETALGGISTATQYWENEATIPQFNNDGKFFSAYAEGAAESAKGTLESSAFTVGGSGWMTYKLGGAKNIEKVYMEAVRESDGKAVKLPNYNWSDYAGSAKRGCSLVAYKVNLIDFCGFALGDSVKIRITDDAENDYGLFFLDSVVTYYTEEPSEDYYLVSKYKLYNGGFESDESGWTKVGDIGVVSTDSKYWHNGTPDTAGNSYDKEGEKLFTWWTWEYAHDDVPGHEINRENNTGTLESSRFILKQNALISFKFGGGCGNNEIYIEVVKADGTVLAKFFNTAPQDGKLIQYHYRFTGMSGDEECFIRVTDNATSGWGCLALDAVNTDCSAEIGTEATNQINA